MLYEKEIRSGRLTIDVRFAQRSLDELVTFASRENPRRAFYFVSRVIGKHLPVRPHIMREIYTLLAEKVPTHSGEKTLVVGLGEAATGLGAGVADSLARRLGSGKNLLYMHTTRHQLGTRPLLEFDECHSHAPDHMLFEPNREHQTLFNSAEHLVLVDDEITSGRTITLLARKQRKLMPALKRVTLLSLVSWLDPALRDKYLLEIQAAGMQASFENLLEGSFHFKQDASYSGLLPVNVERGPSNPGLSEHTGRRGLSFHENAAGLISTPTKQRSPLLVLGNGEFMYHPFLYAEALEANGHDVMFLSSTRTPIVVGDAINTRIDFPSRKLDRVNSVNYLYNLPSGRQVISCYENTHHAQQHGLGQKIHCQQLVPSSSQQSAMEQIGKPVLGGWFAPRFQ